MWVFAAGLMIAGAFGAALVTVRAARPRPFPLEALLAFALLVAFEAVALDALSLLKAVTRPGVLAAHAIAFGAFASVRRGAALRDLARCARRALRSVAGLGVPSLLLVPLAGLAGLSAVRYAPNNWDSMTYHLARVAHWIQQRSIEPYPTHVARQVLLMPGAEYVLAALQVVSGTDRLASLLQLAAWALVVLASSPLARLAGAPRRLSPWAAVIAGALPMGILQASSTQNDLVAAALALAAWVAVTPLLHRTPGAWRGRDVVLLALVLSAAALVKASALVAAAPMVVVATVHVVRSLAAGGVGARKLVRALAASAVVAAVLVGPEIARRSGAEESRALAALAAPYLYPALGEWGDRALNLARGIARHVPLPREAVSATGIAVDPWCGAEICVGQFLGAHEDSAGNPIHVAVAILAAVALAARWGRVPRRAHLFLGATAVAWVSFHLTFRDNEWISRLETPTFALTGLAVVSLAGLSPARMRWAHAATVVIAVSAIAYAIAVASWNVTRAPLAGKPAGGRDVTYYANQPLTQRVHDVVLSAARDVGCTRLGLFIGEDSWDYPLTWRAMQAGIEVRHVFGEDPWPCLVFVDSGLPPAPLVALRWIHTGIPFLYLNAWGSP